jgi:signal transduction histidine kinase
VSTSAPESHSPFRPPVPPFDATVRSDPAVFPGFDPSSPGPDPTRPGPDPTRPGPDPTRPGPDLMRPGPDPLRRRQIHHDLHHELSTITLLASVLDSATDIGPDSRRRVRQILGETRWLHELVLAFERSFAEPDASPVDPVAAVRIDRYAAETVRALQMSTFTRIHLRTQATWARVESLAYWRALRNIVGNAVRAAGPRGRVEVQVRPVAGWALAQVDDDGPGFGEAAPGIGSLGLGIVQDLAASAGGELEIRRGVLGGCCVMLRLPAAPATSTVDHGEEDAGTDL